jgi:hypothetical protein
MKKFLLLLLLWTGIAQAQQYDLFIAHGVTHMNGGQTLTQAHGNATTSQAKMPDLWGWARAKGWTDAEVLSLYYAEAAWSDLFWRAQNGDYNAIAPGHAANIHVRNGKYPVTFPMPFAQGQYTGEGCSYSYTSGTHNYGATEFYVDTAKWNSNRSADRIILRSANWGVEAGPGAWVHHYRIDGIRFNGMRRTAWVPTGTAESAGVAAWDSGEASSIQNCYFNDWERDGILLVRGTPVAIYNCSMFTTSRFGVAIVGSGSVSCYNISGDESGMALVGSIAGYGRPGSTRLAVFGAKQETATSEPFKPWKGSSFLYAEGWINATIEGVSYASGWIKPYDFISWRRDPSVGNFSSITVSGTHFFGEAPRCLFYDESKQLEYRFEGNAWQNSMQSWTWHETQGLKTDWATVLPTVRTNKPGRLQHVGPDGAASWDVAPIYSPTGSHLGTVTQPPTTTPCTYTTGAWSACVNGQQTRTVTATPAGCAGTPPASTQTCTTTTPPSTTTRGRWTFNSGTANPIAAAIGPAMPAVAGSATVSGGLLRNSNGNSSWTLDLPNVTAIVLTGFTPSALNYQLLFHTGSNRGVILLPNGAIVDNSTGSDRPIAPAGTLAVGKSYTGTLTLPAPLTITRFGAGPGAGNCWQGTVDQLEVR